MLLSILIGCVMYSKLDSFKYTSLLHPFSGRCVGFDRYKSDNNRLHNYHHLLLHVVVSRHNMEDTNIYSSILSIKFNSYSKSNYNSLYYNRIYSHVISNRLTRLYEGRRERVKTTPDRRWDIRPIGMMLLLLSIIIILYSMKL